jgi:hypothetical protein
MTHVDLRKGLVVFCLAFLSVAQGQTTSTVVKRFTINGGGGTGTNATTGFRVSGTIGQPSAGKLTGSSLALGGGFWASIVQTGSPPAITAQPVSRTNIVGTTATFAVGVTGAPPITYQWRKNGAGLSDGTNVFGASSSTLTLSNVQPGDAGLYTVMATNLSGAVTSAVARLAVYQGTNVLTFVGNGTNSFGGAIGQGNITLSDDGTRVLGTITRGPGAFDDTLVLYLDSTAGGFSNTAAFSDGGDALRQAISGFDGGANRSVLTNPPGFLPDYAIALSPGESFGGLWRLNAGGNNSLEFVTVVDLTPVGDTSASLYSFSFEVNAIGLPVRCNCSFTFLGTYISTTGYRSAEALPGGVLGMPGWNPFTATNVATYTISGGAALITGQPLSRTNGVGTSASFGVLAGGTPPLGYQWQKSGTNIANGGNLSGATSSTLVLTNLQLVNAGDYRVIVTNSLGSATSLVATLTIVAAPVILEQPQSRTNTLGTTATFSVTVAGAIPLSYQWRRAGTNLSDSGNITGASSAILTLTNVQPIDAANYSVVITNSNGGITSSLAALTVAIPPGITFQPQSRTNIAATTASFTVTATGDLPFGYEWRKDGTSLNEGGNVSGTTNATLTMTNVQPGDAGDYTVVVANFAGTVTSAPARLSVYLGTNAFSFAGNGSNGFGGAIGQGSLTLSDDGTRVLGTITRGPGTFNDALVIYVDSVAGGFSNTVSFADAGDGLRRAISGYDGGVNRGVLTNPPGFLADYAIALSPVGPSFGGLWRLTNGGNNSLAFIAGTDFGPTGNNSATTYAFSFYVTDIGLAPNCQCGFKLLGTFVSATGYRSLEALPGQVAGTAGWNRVTATTFATYNLSGGGPVMATQPSSRTNAAGTTASFSVFSGGTPPLSYQWQREGTNLPSGGNVLGATTAVLTLTNVQLADAASYVVIVTNLLGRVTSSVATLTVAAAPVITGQPQSLTNNVGASATFGVLATGSNPLGYRWRKDGTNLASGGTIVGAISPDLTVTSLQLTNSGGYDVVVTNSFGAVTSVVATLSVIDPPVMLAQPQSRTNVAGTTAIFNVTASGPGPLGYQWEKDGVQLVDATNATLTLTNVQLSDAGLYGVVVTNSFGGTSSSTARLTVYLSTNAFAFGGNGKSGFSAGIGLGSLTLSDDGTRVSGTILKGPGPFSDTLVLFVDSMSGGFSNTLAFEDSADGLRRAISGIDGGTNRSVLTNPPGFLPDYAIGLSPAADLFGGLWRLAAGGTNSFQYVTNVNLSPLGDSLAPAYSFLFEVSDIGLAPNCGCPFKILGTYISDTGYRSDEALPGDVAGIPGWNPFAGLAYATYTISGGVATPPLVLVGPIYGPGNQFRFTVTGPTGATCVVQMSSNVAPANWISIYTNTSPFTFIQTNTAGLPQRFYRALTIP